MRTVGLAIIALFTLTGSGIGLYRFERPPNERDDLKT